jgi:hypothetical protein
MVPIDEGGAAGDIMCVLLINFVMPTQDENKMRSNMLTAPLSCRASGGRRGAAREDTSAERKKNQMQLKL